MTDETSPIFGTAIELPAGILPEGQEGAFVELLPETDFESPDTMEVTAGTAVTVSITDFQSGEAIELTEAFRIRLAYRDGRLGPGGTDDLVLGRVVDGELVFLEDGFELDADGGRISALSLLLGTFAALVPNTAPTDPPPADDGSGGDDTDDSGDETTDSTDGSTDPIAAPDTASDLDYAWSISGVTQCVGSVDTDRTHFAMRLVDDLGNAQYRLTVTDSGTGVQAKADSSPVAAGSFPPISVTFPANGASVFTQVACDPGAATHLGPLDVDRFTAHSWSFQTTNVVTDYPEVGCTTTQWIGSVAVTATYAGPSGLEGSGSYLDFTYDGTVTDAVWEELEGCD